MYTEQALKQAILKAGSGNLCGTIHHSDQGVQYACDAYIRILMEHHIRISMTEDSKPTDNAVAERMKWNTQRMNGSMQCHCLKMKRTHGCRLQE